MEKKNPNIYQRALDIVNNRINPDIPQGGGSGEVPQEVRNAIETGGIGFTGGEVTTIEWDGDTSGKTLVSADGLGAWCKVSTLTPCITDLDGGDVVCSSGVTARINATDIMQQGELLAWADGLLIVVLHPTSFSGLVFDEPGVYFMINESMYITLLTYGQTINKIDTKYLPFDVFNFTVEYYPDMATTGLNVSYADLEAACMNPNIIVNGYLSLPDSGALYQLTKIGGNTHFICFTNFMSGSDTQLHYYKVGIINDDNILIEQGYLIGHESEDT